MNLMRPIWSKNTILLTNVIYRNSKTSIFSKFQGKHFTSLFPPPMFFSPFFTCIRFRLVLNTPRQSCEYRNIVKNHKISPSFKFALDNKRERRLKKGYEYFPVYRDHLKNTGTFTSEINRKL